MKKPMRAIEIGDRFVKLDDAPGRIWTVIDLCKTPNGLLHARLEDDGRSPETRVISVSILGDPRFSIPAQCK